MVILFHEYYVKESDNAVH